MAVSLAELLIPELAVSIAPAWLGSAVASPESLVVASVFKAAAAFHAFPRLTSEPQARAFAVERPAPESIIVVVVLV